MNKRNIVDYEKMRILMGKKNMAKITKERKLEIEERVKKILPNPSSDVSPAVDIVSLVEKNGFTVEAVYMPIDTTGCLFVDDNEKEPKKIIMVNKIFENAEDEEDVVFKKSRFITAHEYGHYILHKSSEQTLYAHRDSDKREEVNEQEADYFARSILMPFDRFKVYFEVCKDLNSDKEDDNFVEIMLSKVFQVTRKKVKARIEDLAQLEG